MKVFTGTVPFSGVRASEVVIRITNGKRPGRPNHPEFSNPLWTFVRRRGRVKDLPSSVSRTCWIGQQDCIEQTRLQYGNVGRTYLNELL
jgi:hypothetical protein